jgi:hypothetical protein
MRQKPVIASEARQSISLRLEAFGRFLKNVLKNILIQIAAIYI